MDVRMAQRRRLEADLGIEILPGTEIMTDINGHNYAESRDQRGGVLIPQPTKNPHDPLNWSRFWKATALTMATLYTLIQPATQIAMAPIFPIFVKEWHVTFSKCANLSGVTVLTLGYINVVWVPFAERFGRRLVMISSLILILGANIWHALATSYDSFLGSSVLEGIGGGPVETLYPMIISDVVFLNDRGKFVTLYLASLFTSLMLSPVVSAAMAENVGWRNYYWLNVGLRGVLIVAAIFAMPETKWSREDSTSVSTLVSVIPASLTKPLQKWWPNLASPGGSNSASPRDSSQAKLSQEYIDEPSKRSPESAAQPVVAEHAGTGKPSKPQFKPWIVQGGTQKSLLFTLARDSLITFKAFFFPIVAFAAFCFSWSASLFGYISWGQAALFSEPPYNFTVQQIGFTNFACFAGTIVGLATGGPLSDWIVERSTRRNGGIREPEMRLPAMIPFIILAIIGQVVAAVGAQNKWPWEPIVIVGYFFVGIQIAALPGIALTYATDCYKPITGQIYLAATIVKNTWGYGVSQFLNNWNESAGFVVTSMFNLALFIFFNAVCGIVMWMWGKKFRRWTQNDVVHHMY